MTELHDKLCDDCKKVLKQHEKEQRRRAKLPTMLQALVKCKTWRQVRREYELRGDLQKFYDGFAKAGMSQAQADEVLDEPFVISQEVWQVKSPYVKD